jgi:hypothetical protein
MSEQLYNEIGQQFVTQHGTSVGQMFGKPCLKTGKKAFAAFFKDEMVFKLGQQEVNLLKDKYVGAVNWDPSGKKRAMKDWLQIPSHFSDDWVELAKQALDYVDANK